jgi:tRNA(Ile)-lysidine synthase TilS/MesJ
VEDPTNTSMKYARNRIRASLRKLSTEGQDVLKLPYLIQFYSPFMLFSQLICYVFNFKIIYHARSMFNEVTLAFS